MHPEWHWRKQEEGCGKGQRGKKVAGLHRGADRNSHGEAGAFDDCGSVMQERINHRVTLPVHHLQGAPEPLFQGEALIEEARNRRGG